MSWLLHLLSRRAGMVVTYSWRTTEETMKMVERIAWFRPHNIYYEAPTSDEITIDDSAHILEMTGGSEISNRVHATKRYPAMTVIRVSGATSAPPVIELPGGTIAHLYMYDS